MSHFKGIPIDSGTRYVTPAGHSAIRDGIKARRGRAVVDEGAGRKPDWLRIRIPGSGHYAKVRDVVHTHRLATVCEESHCPNIAECWNAGTATLMLMGAVCTRACRFCAVDTGNPHGWLDPAEPENAARSVALMKLRHVVLTSVDRDDLPDGGARHYADCIGAIRARNPHTAIEVLTPDFAGCTAAVATVATAGVAVYAHNIETVERLTPDVRDPRAGYAQSLRVLAVARETAPGVLTKSSLMLGLGETADEISQAMDDLRAHGVDILTLGQYLRPTRNHLPVRRYVAPAEFVAWREAGLSRGFREVVAGPLVRSSYRAERALDGNNVGLAGTAVPRVVAGGVTND